MPTPDVKPPCWLQTSEAAQTLAHTLLECYPAAFCAAPAGVLPLQIGMDHDIQQALDIPRQVVHEVLSGDTHRRAYRAALAAPGARRVDLDCQPVAPVAPQHPQWAQQGYRRPAKRAGAPSDAPAAASAPPPAATLRAPIRDVTPYLTQGGKPMDLPQALPASQRLYL